MIPTFLSDILPPDRIQEGGSVIAPQIGGRVPLASVKPRNAEDVAAILVACSRAGLPVRPHGGGTLLGLSERAGQPGIHLDLRSMDKVVDYAYQDLVLTAEAGATLGGLDALLGAKRQRFPYDAPCPQRATLGGTLASGISGPRRPATGLPRDWILGLKAVLPDGTIIKGGGKVVKNVAGYDLQRLFVGSRGTLGVIVEATVKTSPRPEARAWYRLVCGGKESARDAVEILAAAPFPIASCEWTGDSKGEWITLELEGSEVVVRDAGGRLEKLFGGRSLERMEAAAGILESEKARDLVTLHGCPIHLHASVRAGRLPEVLEKVLKHLETTGVHPRFRAHALSGTFDIFLEGTGKPSQGDLVEAVGRSRMACEDRRSGGYLDGFLKILEAPAPFRAKIDAWGGDKGARAMMDRIRGLLDPARILSGMAA